MSNLGNLAATVSLNIDPFQQSARVLETQTRSINRALQASETAWKNNSKNINAQKTQYDLTGKAIQVHTAQLEKQRQKYNGLKAEIGDVNDATVQQKTDLLAAEAAINKTATELEKLTGKYNALGKQIAINESNWTKSGKALEEFGENTSKVGQGFNDFGTKWTLGVTAPIVAGVTAVTTAAISWESSFAGVLKTNDEVIDKNGKVVYSYAELEDGLRNLAKELPSTHAEIASVAEAAGQLGIATQDVISFTKTMIDLGESTNLSAEEAATSIAKIANITGMTSDEYERFGSSVVALGNNFATTESQIVELSNRLAAAGTLAGLSETEILGLATAMSSVGIEAEAGGTAMTQILTAIENAAASGGESLDQFAEIAGMSSEKFAETWNKKPIDAIQSFIKGLGELDSKGESATLVLDEMGLSGVRQSNVLKSLALASDTLTGAVDMSTQAWNENTALSEEAEKRYATVESQLVMLKNEVVDIAIEFGGPFLQALRDGLQVAKPFVEVIADLSRKFSEANPETQQAIVKYLGLAAAIGPAAKLLGGFLQITGGGISSIGKMAQGVGKLSGAYTASKGAIDVATSATGTFAKGAATTGTSIGLMTKAVGWATTSLGGYAGILGAMTTPAGIAIGAIAAVTGAVIIGKKAYEDYQLSGGKWGTEVTKEQDKVIEKSLQLRDEATAHINDYVDGLTNSADKAIEANQAIIDSIQETIDKEHERAIEKAKLIENENIQTELEKQADRDKRIAEQSLRAAQERVDAINAILSRASENSRNLSDYERKYISDNYKQLSAEQLEVAGFTNEQILAIETAYQTDLSKMSRKQLQERAINVHDALDVEQRAYEEQQQIIRDATEGNVDLQKRLLGELEQDHKGNIETMILGYARLGMEQGLSIENMKATWEQYGFTVNEVQALVDASLSKTTDNVDMFAKGVSEADFMWNDMALDPKTGEVRTNMTEMLAEMASTEEGWEQLQFIAKNADLTTNAKEEIAIAIGESDRWNHLSVPDKKLLVDNDIAMYELYETINELGLWNEYNADRKTLGVDNADAVYKTLKSKESLENWNKLSPTLKQLLADGPAKVNTDKATDAIKEFNKLPPKKKKLLTDNLDAVKKINNAKERLNEWNRYKPGQKTITIKADTRGASKAQSTINNVYGKTVYIDVVRRITDYASNSPYAAPLRYAAGTPYHSGGLAVLGDGGKREPYLTPQGEFGISPSTDTLFNLPRGTKVWSSISKMMDSLPRFANGTKFDDTNISRLNFGAFNQQQESRTQRQSNSPTVFIDKIIWNGKEDIRRTMQELGWMVNVDERGQMA